MNDKFLWVGVGIIAVVIAVDLSVLALLISKGYPTFGELTWMKWRVYAAASVLALALLIWLRDDLFFEFALIWGVLALLLTPAIYLYRALKEWQLHVTGLDYISAGPYLSLSCILAFSCLVFISNSYRSKC